jgi:simple sugar transport system ATP-binding protein
MVPGAKLTKIQATLDKRFGTHEVLKGATLSIAGGTVHALCGENGAGKSTMVKIIAGVLAGDRGTIEMQWGTPTGETVTTDVDRWNRRNARSVGIGIVQQHGSFAPTLSVVENTVLGVEPTKGPVLDLHATAAAIAALGKRIGLDVDPWARAEQLSLGAAQRAEIVAALHHGAKLLILDEPTAVLAPVEVDGLLDTLRTLATQGTTIVIVTHKLDEVRRVADDVTVIRAGQTVATFAASGERRFDVRDIARAMVGADLPETTPAPPPAEDAKPALVLDRVTVGGDLRAASLTVRAGEIVGIAGVDGNGQRELALAIAGLTRHTGTVRLGATDVSRATPRARLAAGLAHIPEDRHHGGLVLDATVGENAALGRADITGRFVVNRERVARFATDAVKNLDIRPPDPDALARALSGGNQQKIVIARELSRPNLKVVVASQPTRGVDLGAVARIHDRLRAAAAAGAGVLVISADLDELLALCHRIAVLLRGTIVGESGGAALRADGSRAALGAMMTGAGGAA